MTFQLMDAPLLIGLIECAGGRLWIDDASGGRFVCAGFPGDGRPPAEHAEACTAAWRELARVKSEVLALLEAPAELRERLVDAALSREGRWRQMRRPCRFFCEPAGGPCLRCGGSWSEHFDPAVSAATVGAREAR